MTWDLKNKYKLGVTLRTMRYIRVNSHLPLGIDDTLIKIITLQNLKRMKHSNKGKKERKEKLIKKKY